MTYILTLWLMLSGVPYPDVQYLPPTADCERTAAAIIERNPAIFAYSCVLEVEA